MTIPRWLQQRLADGQRAATLRLCPKCKSPVIVGLDADHAAITAWCDPTPITEMGEAYALVTGRNTYCFANDNGRKILWHRYEWNIRSQRQNPVLATHKCGQPMTPFAAPQTQTTRKAVANDDTPPF